MYHESTPICLVLQKACFIAEYFEGLGMYLYHISKPFGYLYIIPMDSTIKKKSPYSAAMNWRMKAIFGHTKKCTHCWFFIPEYIKLYNIITYYPVSIPVYSYIMLW